MTIDVDYYPTLMKCTDCNREFLFTLAGTMSKSDYDEISLCYTCFGTKFGLSAFEEKQIVDILTKIDDNTGLLFHFLWEVPYSNWPDDIKSRFKQPPPNSNES